MDTFVKIVIVAAQMSVLGCYDFCDEEGRHREGDYCVDDTPDSEMFKPSVFPANLDVPMIEQMNLTAQAVKVTAEHLDDTEGLQGALDVEGLLRVRNMLDQIRVDSALPAVLPEEGTHYVWELAHAADLALTDLGYARDDAPSPPELNPDPGEEFRTDFGNLADQAVGVKTSFQESADASPDRLGTEVCMAVLLDQAMPYYLQTLGENQEEGLRCALRCLANQMDLMVGWCVWDPDSTLSDPFQSPLEIADYMADLCANRLGEDGQCIWGQ